MSGGRKKIRSRRKEEGDRKQEQEQEPRDLHQVQPVQLIRSPQVKKVILIIK